MEKLFTIREASKILGCSDKHLRNLISIGVIESLTVGRGAKVCESDLEQFVEDYKGLDVSNVVGATEAYRIVQARKSRGVKA